MTQPDRLTLWLNDRRWERIILLVALANGLLYMGLVPPWQHYDEPTHFEYAWLIAARGTLPRRGDHDPAMRREVAASMVEHGFFRDLGFRPNLLLQDEPAWIGVSELGHPPFYYLLVALPLRLFRYADVTVQLYVARTASLLLYLLSVGLAGRIVAELVGAGHVLRWAVPATMALLPAYTDLMTAVNNDVGAVVVFSLFLWGAVRIIRRGFSWFRLAWIGGTAALCVLTKNTVAMAVLLVPVALILALGPGGRRWPVWAGLLAIGLVSVLVVLRWDDAAFWYRQTYQAGSTREERAEAPLGEAVLALEVTGSQPGWRLTQPLPRADVQALRGQTVTLGAWIWALEPARVGSPVLDDGSQTTWEPLEVGDAPAFHAITATVAAEAERVRVVLRSLPEGPLKETATVYYDGLTLVEGVRALDQPPVFDDPEGREGTWGGEPITNRLRNGSAELAWPRLRPAVERQLQRVFPRLSGAPHQLLGLLDWSVTGRVYRAALVNMFQSFWARFGWNHVALAPAWYWILAGWTAIGAVGAVVGVMRLKTKGIPSVGQGLVLLAVAGLLVWGLCWLRTDYFRPFLPGARYAYPAIVPTVLALVAGWLVWAPQRAREWATLGLLSGMLLVDVVSLIKIWTLYY